MHTTAIPPVISSEPGLPLRPAGHVMDPVRLGSMHQTRLSFARSLIRQMARERWGIECQEFRLDAGGCGRAIYTVRTPEDRFSFVIFSQSLDESERSDRVIADQWDVACALCTGDLDAATLDELAENVPRQEAGRCSSRVLVLTRGNRSQRNFELVTDALARGRQPDPLWFQKVGYLYRTTAVYGNGKFGIADYDYVRRWRLFDRPFSPQMLAVWLLRHFSLEQVEHMARARAPDTAVSMHRDLARYVGMGNSTGLGMAPFLVHHPQLINQWVLMRETALARVRRFGVANVAGLERLLALVSRARRHVSEWWTDDPCQLEANARTADDLSDLQAWLGRQTPVPGDLCERVIRRAEAQYGVQTQELVNSLLLELHPELVDALEDTMGSDERSDLEPAMPLHTLVAHMENAYDWALAVDFGHPDANHYFWYRSEEKEEPRLGVRGVDPGADREMPLGIARDVRRCYDACRVLLAEDPQATVLELVLQRRDLRGIVRRVQTLAPLSYGEIRGNLLDRGCRPIHLLRCKLAFFGASKFDPRSDRWVRITLFQGAPLLDELHASADPDWFLPVAPDPA
ncbi:hypothetical protein [Aquisalimonas asiatica]|uniref:Uncharacterized protein n=1 Tax=Aquisalimonas asiatica TaxID=406100 RepID=A0A1H8SJ33_9GAMM|nr:hypothetical protein [Aquisalimonas asiatica]SEO78682.1 hypothetical protein SAMN04488052_1034 [Aquisalimonas asiatica]